MDQATHNRIVSFIWGIADDVLRDLFRRAKYPDVILPMCVIHRLDAVLEPTKATAELKDGDVTTLLAFQGAELVGFAQVQLKAAPSCVTSERPIELHRFYFLKSAQGQGLAAPLMHSALEAARELGGLCIWLGVWERNPRAIAFYLKSGFVKTGSDAFIVGGDRQTDFVFVCLLGTEVARAASEEVPSK